MTLERTKTVWSNQERTRHFIIADDADLPAGDFVLRTVVGRQMDVDEAAALPYEVSREEAKTFLSGQMAGVFDEAKGALLNLLRKSQQKGPAASPATAAPAAAHASPSDAEAAPKRPPEHTLTHLANRITDSLSESEKERFERFTRGLSATVKDLGKIVDGTFTEDETRMQEARDRMHDLRLKLQDHGLPLGDSLDQLPDKLRTLYTAAQAAKDDPTARAQRLEDMADWVEKAAQTFAQRLRDQAQTLREQPLQPDPDNAS